jgi:hypothetical protein
MAPQFAAVYRIWETHKTAIFFSKMIVGLDIKNISWIDDNNRGIY